MPVTLCCLNFSLPFHPVAVPAARLPSSAAWFAGRDRVGSGRAVSAVSFPIIPYHQEVVELLSLSPL